MTNRRYKRFKDYYKKQEVMSENIIFVICSNCGESFEESPSFAGADYNSMGCCPHCGSYQNY